MKSRRRIAGLLLGFGGMLVTVGVSGSALAQSTPTERTFDSGDTPSPFPFWDYASGQYKAECTSSGTIVAISYNPFGTTGTTPHSVLCATPETIPITYSQTNPPNASYETNESFSSSDSANYNAHSTGDWDHGYYKGECPLRSMVVGMAQTTSSQQENTLHCSDTDGVSCSTYGVAFPSNKTCHAVTLGGGGGAWGGWSTFPYNVIGCGTGEVVVGLSVDTTNHQPHAILCCDAPRTIC